MLAGPVPSLLSLQPCDSQANKSNPEPDYRWIAERRLPCVFWLFICFFLRTKKISGWKIEGSTKQVGQQQNFIGNKHPAFFFAVKKHRRSPRNHKRRSSAGRPACPAGHIWGEESGWGVWKIIGGGAKWLRTPRHDWGVENHLRKKHRI